MALKWLSQKNGQPREYTCTGHVLVFETT